MLQANEQTLNVHNFPDWLRNQLTTVCLEQVLCHTEKSCIASYYRQFSTNNRIKTSFRGLAVYNTMR